MTRRERLETKLQKRQDWAASAERRATARSDAAHKLADLIPMGQPILVGHHSEKGRRRDLARIQGNMFAALAEGNKAKDHASKASGLADQLDHSIYSDDPDAVDALQARIAELEASHARMKATNAAYRKRDAVALAALDSLSPDEWDARLADAYSWHKQPHPGYELSLSTANISRLKKRVADVQVRQQRTEQAEVAGGVVIEGDGDYYRVTFAEKPEREVLQALRTAGFRWGGGSWIGRRAELPTELAEKQER